MPVTVRWHNTEHSIILYKISGKWTWDEMFAAIDDCYVMMDEVNHTVATIFDTREALGLPLNALTNMRNLNRRRHANSGRVLIVGLTPLYRNLLNLFSKLYGFSNPNGVQFLANLAEAEAILAEQKPA